MANSYYTYRTNYFKVKDLNRLEEIVENVGAELFTGENNTYGFGALDTENSYDNFYDENENEFETTEEIQKILEDDETCFIIENTNERLRTVNNFITAITKDKIIIHDAMDIIKSYNVNNEYNKNMMY